MQQLLNRLEGKEPSLTSAWSLYHRTAEHQASGHTEGVQGNGLVSQRNLIAKPQDSSRAQIISHLRSSEDIHHLDKIEDSAAKYDITSDESLSEALASHCFIGSSFQTRTLDSGIGTFPPPDTAGCVLGKSFPRTKLGQQEPPTAVRGMTRGMGNITRKARTLERELQSPGHAHRGQDTQPAPDIHHVPRERVHELTASDRSDLS
ncbi:nck-associated protein 5-like [Carcharodon carcharias]|uniref:nck-associated protein 5-like n=1 Tax=Carcharodon carcharias TaxID=13397 RepID=UPI001B7F3902|nr:nck-associated protein 5-like [Carcharodon carcharias]